MSGPSDILLAEVVNLVDADLKGLDLLEAFHQALPRVAAQGDAGTSRALDRLETALEAALRGGTEAVGREHHRLGRAAQRAPRHERPIIVSFLNAHQPLRSDR